MDNNKGSKRKLLADIGAMFAMLIGVIAYSPFFYLFLFTSFVAFGLVCYFVKGFLVNFFSLLIIAFLCFHGWKGLTHVLEDYVFDPVMRSLFVFLINLILLRLLLIIFF